MRKCPVLPQVLKVSIFKIIMADKPILNITKREFIEKCKNSKNTMFIINKSIYDVTEYLSEHPGGEIVLLDESGKDATLAFEDVGHSEDARELMKEYKIGEIIPEIDDKSKYPKSCFNSKTVVCILSPIAIGAIAFLVYRICAKLK